MKNLLKRIVSLALILTMCFGLFATRGYVHAEDGAITFKKNSSDGSNDLTSSTIANQIETGSELIKSYGTVTKVYQGKNGLKFGTSSVTGSLTFTTNDSFSELVITACQYVKDTGYFKVNNKAPNEGAGSLSTESKLTYTFNEPTSIFTIETSAKRGYLYKIEFFSSGETIESTISYELDGGTCANLPETYIEGRTKDLSSYIPTKEGYNFDGWYTDSEYNNKITEISKETTGSISLYAKWVVKAIYNVNYIDLETDEPIIFEDSKYSSFYGEDGLSSLPTPTKVGYKFNCWWDEETNVVTSIPKNTNNDVDLYAVFNRINKIILKDTLNKTEVLKEQIENESSLSISETCSYKGYIFSGWVDEDGQNVTSIKESNNEDITLTAKYVSVINETSAFSSLKNVASMEGTSANLRLIVNIITKYEQEDFELVKVTTADDLNDGDKVVLIAELGGSNFIAANKLNDTKLDGTKVDDIENLSNIDSYVFTLKLTDDKYNLLLNDGNMLSRSSKNFISVKNDGVKWSTGSAFDGLYFYDNSVSTNNKICYNSDVQGFKSYTGSTTTNTGSVQPVANIYKVNYSYSGDKVTTYELKESSIRFGTRVNKEVYNNIINVAPNAKFGVMLVKDTDLKALNYTSINSVTDFSNSVFHKVEAKNMGYVDSEFNAVADANAEGFAYVQFFAVINKVKDVNCVYHACAYVEIDGFIYLMEQEKCYSVTDILKIYADNAEEYGLNKAEFEALYNQSKGE